MNFTDHGTKIENDLIPLAMANGIEWSVLRKKYRDRFNNLYRFRVAPLCYIMWFFGAVIGMFHKPKWVKRDFEGKRI